MTAFLTDIITKKLPLKIEEKETETGIIPLVQNDTSIPVSDTYATITYYNTTYGVKIGYMRNGDIILSMQGGTSTAYEYLYFVLGAVPNGVTITQSHNTSSSYATACTELIYACVIRGITQKVNISVAINARNSTGDCVICTINIAQV